MTKRRTTQQLLVERGRFTMADVRRMNGSLPVSMASDWRDPFWLLDRGRGAPSKVSFEDVPSGFEDSARMLVWLAMLPTGGRNRLKPGTLYQLSAQFGRVIGFVDAMLANVHPGVARDLNRVLPAHFQAFCQATLLLARDDAVGNAVTRGSAKHFLRLWKLLSEIAPEMKAAGVPALTFSLSGTDINATDRSYPERSSNAFGALPDAAAALAMTTAMTHIERGGEDMVRFLVSVVNALEADGDNAGRQFVNAVRSFEWSSGEDGKAWISTPSTSQAHHLLGFARRVVSRMVGACVFVIFQELGCRPEEFEHFSAGRDPETHLPGCVQRMETGALWLFLVHGLVFKQRDEQGEPEIWTAGVTGVGANELPPAVIALDVLERLCAPARDMLGGCSSLAVNIDIRSAKSDRQASLKPMRPIILVQRMKQFLKDIDWSSLAEREDCTPVVADGGARISSRVLRKSLVAYGMRLDPTLKEPLRGQLHHLDADETDGSYLTSDPAILERATDFSSMEVARMMLEKSGAAAHPGGVGEALAPHMADVEQLKERVAPPDWLEHTAALVKGRGLATARTHVTVAAGFEPAPRGPALLQRYRASRRAVLDGRRLGIPGEYRAIEARAEEAKRALEAMGLDVPADEEVLRG